MRRTHGDAVVQQRVLPRGLRLLQLYRVECVYKVVRRWHELAHAYRHDDACMRRCGVRRKQPDAAV